MKKILAFSYLLVSSIGFAQNYYGTEFIGESRNNLPLNVSKNANKIAIAGYIGGDLTGSFPITFKGGNVDGTVTSISAVDGKIQWIKQFSSNLDDVVTDVAIDNAGNYYLTGYFMGAGSNAMDADPGPGIYPLGVDSPSANRDIFIIKLDTNGNFVWAKKMSSPIGIPNDDASTISLDSKGNIYIAGSYQYVDFDPGTDANTESQLYAATGNTDGFIVKLDANGNFVWVKTLEGSSNKKILDLVIDQNDDIYVTGRFQGTVDLDTDPIKTDLRTTAGNFDTFVAKYTQSGQYVWGKTYGSTASDTPEKIIVSNNTVYVGGSFTGTVDLDPSAGTNTYTSAGGSDGYVSKFLTDGTYVSSYVIPGTTTNLDSVKDMYVDPVTGKLYLTGFFQNIMINGTNYASDVANSDIYYLELDSNFVFSSIYLIKGAQEQNSTTFINQLNNGRFVAAGTTTGATSFDYRNPGVTDNPSAAVYYTYITKFDFKTTALGTQDVAEISNFGIYPNPASSELFIKSDSKIKTVNIFNIEGKKVYSNNSAEISNINIGVLNSGMYLVQAIDETGKSSQTKLIKK